MRFSRSPGRQGRLVALGFALVAAGFVISTAYSQYRASAIAASAIDIEQSAAPSVHRLAMARVELERLVRLVDDLVDDRLARCPADAAAAEAARARVAAELDAYFALPTFAGERVLWAQLHGEVSRLDGALGRVLAQSEAGDAAARGTLQRAFAPAAERASAAMLGLIDLNARLAHDRAQVIERLRRRSLVLAVLLDVGALALAALAALWLRREIRQHEALAEEHTRLLELRADELEQFAARVAHDVQSPLTALDLSLARAERAPTLESARGALASGRRSLRRASLITRDLLSFARAGAHPERDGRAALREALEGALEDLRPVAEDEAVELVVEPVPSCAAACAPGVLTSLLSNLVHNAIKYIGDGPQRRIVIRCRSDEGRVRVEVQDSGPGMEPELQALAFQPFFRGANLSAAGIGLGLSTVRRLCERHGGQVGVESALGKGCLFWFELPAAGDGAKSPVGQADPGR